MTFRPHHTYVLRIWLESDSNSAGWRASISDISGLEQPERRYFHDFDTLIVFLKEQLDTLHADGGFGSVIPERELEG